MLPIFLPSIRMNSAVSITESSGLSLSDRSQTPSDSMLRNAMKPELIQASAEEALHALNWALGVAERGREGASALPPRPTVPQWHSLSISEMRAVMDPLITSRYVDEALDALLEIGFLDVWLPEIAVMVGFSDGEWRHKDVWKHTKQVVWQSVPRLAVRWAALLHDIGKPKTRTFGARGEVHFFGHSEVGASMFRKRVAARLGFTDALYERVHFLILNHLRASQYDGGWTDSAVRRFAKEMGEGLTDLLDLSRADITTKRPEKRKRGLHYISSLSARIRKIQEIDARLPPLPKGMGDAIMQVFQIPPSKRIGFIRDALETRIKNNEIEPNRDSDYYIEWLRAHPEDLCSHTPSA